MKRGLNIEKLGHIFCNYQWNFDGITVSNLIPVGMFSVLQSNRKFYHIYNVTTVIDDYAKDGGEGEELFTKMHCVRIKIP